MQDGAEIPGDDASAWLRDRFAGESDPEVRIDWSVNEAHDPGAYGRLLKLLFLPRADRPAA